MRYVDASPLTGREIMEALNIQPSKEVGLVKKRLASLVLEGNMDANDTGAAREQLELIYDEVLKNHDH
jgi:hypothetical protein